MNKKIITIISFIFLASCSTTSTRSSQDLALDLSLNQVEKLNIGNVDANDVKKALGDPDQVMQVRSQSQGNVWIYLDKASKSPRVSLFFDDETRKLMSATWFVREQDPEVQLSSAKRRYPHAKFEIIKSKWETGHSAPADEVYYFDKNLGLKLIYSPVPNQVRSIVRIASKQGQVSDRTVSSSVK